MEIETNNIKKNDKAEKPKKKRDGEKIFLRIAFLTSLVVITLMYRNYHGKNRYSTVKGYLIDNYYSATNIERAIRDKLGDTGASDDSKKYVIENFDRYAIKLILDDIGTKEDAHKAYYNDYLIKLYADPIMSQIDEYEKVSVKKYDDALYIKINSFNADETYKDLLNYCDLFAENRNFIIDLTSNPGGSTRELVKVFSLFYPNKSEVFRTSARDSVSSQKTSDDPKINFDQLVFLCSENTASCAECMIFNMQTDYPDKVVVIGQKTYGKNFCYCYKQFNDGDMVLFVNGVMVNSKGETWPEDGIEPDISVTPGEELETGLEYLGGSNIGLPAEPTNEP